MYSRFTRYVYATNKMLFDRYLNVFILFGILNTLDVNMIIKILYLRISSSFDILSNILKTNSSAEPKILYLISFYIFCLFFTKFLILLDLIYGSLSLVKIYDKFIEISREEYI